MQKIMFNDEVRLTQLVLERIKNTTRRTIPQKTLDYVFNDFRQAYYEASLDWLTEKEVLEQCFFVDKMKKLPYQIGEEVAIAQRYEVLANGGYLDEMIILSNNSVGFEFKPEYCGKGYGNKMFVRAELMPHRIRITDIKIERLQDISDEDSLMEGIQSILTPEGIKYVAGGNKAPNKIETHLCNCFETPREAFAALIDKVSGRGTWEKNPWVFAYSFELVR